MMLRARFIGSDFPQTIHVKSLIISASQTAVFSTGQQLQGLTVQSHCIRRDLIDCREDVEKKSSHFSRKEVDKINLAGEKEESN